MDLMTEKQRQQLLRRGLAEIMNSMGKGTRKKKPRPNPRPRPY